MKKISSHVMVLIVLFVIILIFGVTVRIMCVKGFVRGSRNRLKANKIGFELDNSNQSTPEESEITVKQGEQSLNKRFFSEKCNVDNIENESNSASDREVFERAIQAYNDYLQTNVLGNEDYSDTTFWLSFINRDSVPELLLIDDVTSIYSYINGEVYYLGSFSNIDCVIKERAGYVAVVNTSLEQMEDTKNWHYTESTVGYNVADCIKMISKGHYITIDDCIGFHYRSVDIYDQNSFIANSDLVLEKTLLETQYWITQNNTEQEVSEDELNQYLNNNVPQGIRTMSGLNSDIIMKGFVQKDWKEENIYSAFKEKIYPSYFEALLAYQGEISGDRSIALYDFNKDGVQDLFFLSYDQYNPRGSGHYLFHVFTMKEEGAVEIFCAEILVFGEVDVYMKEGESAIYILVSRETIQNTSPTIYRFDFSEKGVYLNWSEYIKQEKSFGSTETNCFYFNGDLNAAHVHDINNRVACIHSSRFEIEENTYNAYYDSFTDSPMVLLVLSDAFAHNNQENLLSSIMPNIAMTYEEAIQTLYGN